MRHLSLIFAFGLAVLAATGSARSGNSPAADLVAKKAAVLEMLHGKARKALVTAAQDKSFHDYFATTSPTARARLKSRIDRILLEVQRRFHVEEMCVITPDGVEIARIIDDAIAYDLDDTEHDRPFFRPGFALAPRTVDQSAPYLSPDAHRWVISYVTPIVIGTETKAILQYEHSLGVYQTILNKGVGDGGSLLVAVDQQGWVISDSRAAVDIDARGGSEAASDYFRRFEWGGLSLAELRARLGDGGADEFAVGGRTYDVALKSVAGWTLVAVVAR